MAVVLEHVQFLWKLNMLQLLAFVAFSGGESVSTFPENALGENRHCAYGTWAEDINR
jgi:hypothetical protein